MTYGLFSSLRCFERFFRGVNVKEGKLVAKRRAYLMEDLNLIGVDYLWQVTTVVSTARKQSLFVLTLSFNKILRQCNVKSKPGVLTAWNNHRG